MEIKKNSILDFLTEINSIEIPLWQREFIWNDLQIIQLFEDLESIINSPNILSHFLGIIIHHPFSNVFSSTRLIDGHQRIVAISILIYAICNHFQAESYKRALLYSHMAEEKTPKIISINQYNDEYYNILINEDFAHLENSNYTKLYRFFLDKIEANSYSLEDYFNALKKFEIAEIILTQDDNDQLIFDSINSIGIKLNNFEKIKNYIFMGLSNEEQLNVWNNYWKPLEQLFKNNEDLFNQFMISYISMQTEKSTDEKNLCISFNKFYNYKRKYKKGSLIVAELYKFAQYYLRLKNADFTKEIANELEKIIQFYDKPELYAFLFEITDDFQNGLIPQKIYIDILANTYIHLKVANEKQEKINFTNLSKTISKMLAQKYGQGN